ncbi:MAG: hypothetical protein ABIB98_01380 [bacterium]
MSIFFFVTLSLNCYASFDILNSAGDSIKNAKTYLEEAKSSLVKAEGILNYGLELFKFVEEKIGLLYNFESFANRTYSDINKWAQDALKWAKEEKEEEVIKLNYEYNYCYTNI